MTMQGASRESLAQAQERLEALVSDPGTDALPVAEELFAVTRLLDRAIALRRVLSDPSANRDNKADLATSLLRGQVSDATLDLVRDVVRLRWSRVRDLADAMELLSVTAAVAAAEREGWLDDVEDEVFRFGRIIAGDPQLRGMLVDRSVPAERKVELLRTLLADKVRPVSLQLISQVVTQPRGRSLEDALEDYATVAAARRQRILGTVRTPIALTDEQRSRLRAALRRIYGREVQLNVVVDPDVAGGMSVQVGDEVIDGTVVSKLAEARRRLTG
jgi:F-type H+-transporting ATPase subunit delta